MRIEPISSTELAGQLVDFTALLRDAVEHGASIGFVLPLAEAEAAEYWRKVAADTAAGLKLVLAARDEQGRLAGSVQLALESRANGRHRAEVQKLMVLASRRGRGLGAELMRRLEMEAAGRGRRILFLDTSEGEAGARRFYERLGYTYVGGIPDYAADPDGRFSANAIFYKRVG
jgi:acetyltransferase